MKTSWKQSAAVRAAAVTLSIVFLWGAGVSMLAVLLNFATGFADSSASLNSAVLDIAESRESNRLLYYIETALKTAESTSADSAENASLMREFEAYFSPEKTNLRFTAEDAAGNLLLTNDQNSGKDSEVLASNITVHEVTKNYRSYQVKQRLENPVENYAAFMNNGLDLAKYLENPSDFQIWYFTDDLVDLAYHDGFDAVEYSEKYTDFLRFDTLAQAQEYDYEMFYGPFCTWGLYNAEDENSALAHAPFQYDDAGYWEEDDDTTAAVQIPPSADTGAAPVIVVVTAYDNQDQIYTSMQQYYLMKEAGKNIFAADDELEQKLTAGLDITISAAHTETETVYLHTYLPADMPVQDTISANYTVLAAVSRYSEWFVVGMFACLALTVISCMVMCTAAGHSAEHGGIHVGSVHRIGYEAFWLLPIAAFAAAVVMFQLLIGIDTPYRTLGIFCGGMILLIAACSVLWLYTTAVRAKSDTFWSSFFFSRMFRQFFGLFRNKTVTCIMLVIYMGALLLFNVGLLPHADFFIGSAILGTDLLTMLGTVYCVYAYFELHAHVKQIETGDFSPAEHLIPLGADFARFDRSLNDITNGISTVVAQQTKAEHMRTELITNVSHDLKTPLTSIVNYVDLLSREPMQTDAAAEYLEVLKRQAARLKKLTIDLVEASKASTGNLNVELMPTNLQVLIGQLSGEYDERLRERQLSLICTLPEEPLHMLADSRLIWRVFDNLLNNACKYAMEGTRVYLEAAALNGTVIIEMKNISACPLGVSPDDLMERFVRGDSSRHTEGSGLGLSIARDLTGLQNGTLKLVTDGDLFKAILQFPQYQMPMQAEQLAGSFAYLE